MSLLVLHSSNDPRTILPKRRKTNRGGSKLHKLFTATIGSGILLKEAVKLPPGEDINEWFAINTVDFYNQINMLYATLGEFCTHTACPIMNAGSRYEYRWADGVTVKKPLKVSAPEYIEYLMDWIGTQVDNESIFPQKLGEPFPPNFEIFVKTILKKLFRVYAHIYRSHFDKVVALKEEAHLNTCFKQFILFIDEFQLVTKEELAPLKDLVENILSQP